MKRATLWAGTIGGLALAMLALPQIILAHGGGAPQLINAPAGPYRLSVWSQPDPLPVGTAHFTVAVTEPPLAGAPPNEAGSPILGATVRLEIRPLDAAGPTLTVSATHQNATNKIFYEADVEIPSAGRWQVVALIDGPDGPGQTDFELEVGPEPALNWPLIAGVGFGFLLLGWWLVGRFRP